ncbi:carbohydrate-binding family 9-like protein [Pedobacter metabolipauper]|uniref:Carbohydrate binding protein with CBM9 domain n=1 Tax=Pedobacter metabolipauper TaxID=425513 RepID=A0A4R6T1A4_9SPHI|nr:carbohydrate-binding family 9-like protein [Pedobacter metabolipauper]TDQ11388.1 carbohydrate binding protein with CBM9 domain [Pedobacter metabolipauper]
MEFKRKRFNQQGVRPVLLCLGLSLVTYTAGAQELFKGYENLFTPPKQYTAGFTTVKPLIDGDINDTIWKNIPWTDNFVDIEGDKKPKPHLATRCKMIWDKESLYIAVEMKEPQVWANISKHDEVIFYDNDFEVFLDPDNDTHQYMEIELNALNTVWDLFLNKPYRNNGTPLNNWEARGLRTAVKIQGTINKSTDLDQGWTVEMAIPYEAIKTDHTAKIPKDGDLWRINFSRVEWDTEIVNGLYVKKKDPAGKGLPERNWVWSPQGVINMHLPERWGYLYFSTDTIQPNYEKQKEYLWLAYYKQKDYQQKNGKYANTLNELAMSDTYAIADKPFTLILEATASQFYITLKINEQTSLTINQDGLIKTIKR